MTGYKEDMKQYALITPFVLAAFLLGAHFMRMGMTPMASLCLGFPCILFFKEPFALLAARVFLVLACIEWGATLFFLVEERVMLGQDWYRLAAIMMGVVCFNILAFVCLFHEKLRTAYKGRK